MTSGKKIHLEISEAEINRIIDEIESSNLADKTREKLIALLETIVRLDEIIGMKETTIARLRKIFGKKSEKLPVPIGESEPKNSGSKPGNGGRHGEADYPVAQSQMHDHESLSVGDECSECGRGTLHRYEPGVYVKITGSAPLTATVHRTEKLRCSGCGAIFEANFEGRDSPKYDAKARAIIALLKYGASTPFYRLAKIQKGLLTPVPASTQWDLMEELGNDLFPIWKQLVKTSAQSEISHIDDTTAKILSLMKDNRLEQNRGTEKKRSGMWTTGLLAKLSEKHHVVLYFTGPKYAGENLDDFLMKRDPALPPMVIMSDALSTNNPKRNEVYKTLCNSHGRRGFLDLADKYKAESEYVLNLIRQVYFNEKMTVEKGMSADERLQYHAEKSEPLMIELEEWCRRQFDERLVEPNSSLGKGIAYILKNWVELTHFCRTPGIPLDNNILEEKLRLPVLNRKNFLFYRTTLGALVGDVLTSVIKTCDVNQVNPFEYMSQIQEHALEVKKNPEAWLPWNYHENLPAPESNTTS